MLFPYCLVFASLSLENQISVQNSGTSERVRPPKQDRDGRDTSHKHDCSHLLYIYRKLLIGLPTPWKINKGHLVGTENNRNLLLSYWYMYSSFVV